MARATRIACSNAISVAEGRVRIGADGPMRYLKADWKRWSVSERVAAVVLGAAFIALYAWSWMGHVAA